MINYHKIAEDLKQKISGDISYSKVDLEKHAKDASLFFVMPALIIYPKDKYDISQIVKYISNLKKTEPENYSDLSLTVRAAGTCMSGGSLNNSIILDVTKYLKNISQVQREKNRIKVGQDNSFDSFESIYCEPGAYFRDVEKVIEMRNLMFPSYPASKDLCCVGGIVANNSAGEKTYLYGQTKDWVEEVEMVLNDGNIWNFKSISFNEMNDLINSESKDIPDIVKNIYKEVVELIEKNIKTIQANTPKVSKNSSGYYLWEVIDHVNKKVNLAKLIVGSQGTFGIITKVKLNLIEKKKYSQMLTVLMPNLNTLVPLVEEIKKYKPEAIESFDDHTFVVAMRFLPSILWKMKGSIFQLGMSFIPEMWMALTGGIPKLILMAEFTGTSQDEANAKALKAYENIIKFGYKARVTKNEVDLSKYWTFRRESFNLLRSKLRGMRTAPFVEDIIVPVDAMVEFIPQMQAVLDKYKFTYTIAGHAGNGNFHIIPLMKLSSDDEIDTIKKTNLEIFELVKKYRGSISAEHNDGLVRTPYLNYMFDEKMLRIFSSVKNIFDPQNIFNPGKKVGGSIEENYKKIKLTNL